jgi:hypothetical protein
MVFRRFQPRAGSAQARFTRLRGLDTLIGALPLTAIRRQLLIKDVKTFLRDVSQWSQLLLLVALVLLYLCTSASSISIAFRT